MKLVILGATGTTGALAVKEALAAGHEVLAYVRNPARLAPSPGLTIVTGSVEDAAAMTAAFKGADAVLWCLGARWAPVMLFRRVDFQQRTLPRVIEAINDAGVKRFVLMSSLGVGDTASRQSPMLRLLLTGIVARNLFRDKQIAKRALDDCRARWTAVYPVVLKDGPAEPDWDLIPIDRVKKVPGNPTLTFATVARALVALTLEQGEAGGKLLLAPKGQWQG